MRKLIFSSLLLTVVLCVALLSPSHAATGLAVVCPTASEEGKPVVSSCNVANNQSGQLYKTPLVSDLVRVDPTRVRGDRADWTNNTTFVWKKFANLATGELYETCKTDIPDPSGFQDAAQCTDWEFAPKASVVPSFSVTPTSGVAPLQVRVTWNISGGTNCQAGGTWSGTKAAVGSEDLTLTVGAKSFGLTCTTMTGPPAKGQAVITWTAPTQNTDGSTLTNLKGYQLFSGTTSPPTTLLPLTNPSQVSYTYGNLDPGTYYFMIKSVNSSDTVSDPSGVGSKVIPNTPTPVPWSATPLTVTVTDPAPLPTKPRAPVITVQ